MPYQLTLITFRISLEKNIVFFLSIIYFLLILFLLCVFYNFRIYSQHVLLIERNNFKSQDDIILKRLPASILAHIYSFFDI